MGSVRKRSKRVCPPRDRNVRKSRTPSRVCRSVRDPLAPVPGVCVGVRKRRINARQSFQSRFPSSGFSLKVGVGKKKSWSRSFLKMGALCMLKFYSSPIGISQC